MAQRLTAEVKAERAQALEAHKAEMAAKKLARAEAKVAADALRAEKKVARETKKAERAVKKVEVAERKLARAAKKAEREANPRVPHLAKVCKAEDGLPEPSDAVARNLDNCTKYLTPTECQLLCAYLDLHVRKQRVVQSNALQGLGFKVGDTVTITGGSDARLHGATGTISRLRRIRAFVDVPERDKPVYLFTSEMQPVG